ncbi:hypothetical protein BRPE64_ACDS16680 [Caballeronia insecticola]|uniref:Uncharacterized protein n=1 Tax=Caballeronia insecticola TaxID=758793 RepID=R4WYS2_9BURK|nr:hypothetical protein BRPE64_ACDS16680 [Caballeronia insecticola]
MVDVGNDGDIAEGASHRKCLGCAPTERASCETPWLGSPS